MHINLIDAQHMGGGQLTPQSSAYLKPTGARRLPPWSKPVAELRAESSANLRATLAPYPPPEGATVRRMKLTEPTGERWAWVYTPEGAGPFPLLVYYHGGGWVAGEPDECEGASITLASGGGCVVVNADYRLAPEHPFPAAAEDCYSVVGWAREHAALLNIDPARLALAGDSAGGNLAAVVALMLRDRGAAVMPRLQILIYPATELRDLAWPSYAHYSAYGLSAAEVAWYRDQYAPNPQERGQPYLSPCLAPDLSHLPPALVITAEFDVLRDEGEAYGHRLEEAGGQVTCSRYLGTVHGFATMPGVFPEADLALAEMTAALRRALA